MKLRTKLFDFQKECVQEVEDFGGRALLALPMGGTKSLLSLLYLYNHPEIERAIVVCPASIKWVWESEARKHFGMRVEILESRKVTIGKVSPRTKLYVINYDILNSWLSFLKDLNPRLIIGDEIHYISGRTTLRARAFSKLCEGVPHILGLSGTPLVNRPAELWPILNVLRPDKWPNFYQYAHTHCNPKLNHWGQWDFSGASRLATLHRKLRNYCLVRRSHEQIFKDLPPQSRNVVPLDVNNRSEYNRAVKDFLGWLREVKPEKVYRAARAKKIVQLGYLVRLASFGKLPKIYEWIDNYLSSEEKLLVFGVHNKILRSLEERYQGMCVRVDGSVVGSKRQKAFEQFNKHKGTRLLFGNIKAAGVGWSCTATSDVAVVETGWSPGELMQAERRCFGVGRGLKDKKARSWLLVAHSTIEEKLCDILQRKQRVVTNTLDGKKVKNELEVYDQLLLELEKGSL